MQFIFIFISIIGAMYFLFSKRRFDFLSLAYFSAVAYFLPGFFGYVLYPPFNTPAPLNEGAYGVMLLVLSGVLIGGVVNDRYINRLDAPDLPISSSMAKGDPGLLTIVLLVTGACFFLSFITNSEALFMADKGEMLSELNRWHIGWVTGASIGAVLAFRLKKYVMFAICMLMLLFDMYIGFRTSLAITTMAIITLYFFDKGHQQMAVNSLKPLLLSVLFVFCFFVYKFVYVFIKLGFWEHVTERLGDPDFYLRTIIESEPFSTQAILNEVIARDFRVGLDHFVGVIYQFILFAPELGLSSETFNALYQPYLFPGAIWGMASNIWAEMWSSGGWPLLIAFVIFFILMLAWGSRMLPRCSPPSQAFFALFFSSFAFYIHRNDIIYQINLEKRLVFMWVVCFLFSKLFLGSHLSRKSATDQPGSKL